MAKALRANFEEEFSRREAEGRAHPCFFGDVALVRILRGNEDNVEQATRWFKDFLDVADRSKVDQLVADASKILDEAPSLDSIVDLLPYADEVRKYFRIYTAPSLAPSGDVVQYIPVVDLDKRGLYEEMDWSHWIAFCKAFVIMRCVQCERLSRSQGRLVQCITVVDIQDCSFDTMFYKPFDRDQVEVQQFARSICAEVFGPLHIFNASWTISTLLSVVKRLMPRKLVDKLNFHRGEILQDEQLCTSLGGKEQLEKLLASREGLALQRAKEDGEDETPVETDALPSEEELENINMLRQEFSEQLDVRKTAGTDYPFFFGDIAMVRLLRGNGGRYRSASRWLRRFLQQLEEWDVDALVQDVKQRLPEGGIKNWKGEVDLLPHSKEVMKYLRMVPRAARLSANGDILQYMAVCDLDRRGILENLEWEQWVTFMRALMVLKVMDCDHQSAVQGRVVKCINIFDLCDCSITGLRDPEFDMKHQRDVFNFLKSICIEINGPQYVLNGPWILVRIFRIVAGLLPKNFLNKIHIMDGDGSSDPAFVEVVGGEAQLQQLLASRVGLCNLGSDAENKGRADIGAGQVFEKFVDVAGGQRLQWRFSVEAGYADSFLGKSDVGFSVSLVDIPDKIDETEDAAADDGAEDEEGSVGTTIEAESMVEASNPEVTGYYNAEKPGCIVLRWSNEHSSLRGKTVCYTVETVEQPANKGSPEQAL